MSLDRDKVEALLSQPESTTLDFKDAGYLAAGAKPEQKSRIVKHILAFANTYRREDAYILIGVKEQPGSRAIVTGLLQHLDGAHLQELVNKKTNRAVEFEYDTVTIDGKNVGVVRIPPQPRPTWLKKDFGTMKAGEVRVRQGSSTFVASPEQIYKMGVEDMGRSGDAERGSLDSILKNATFHKRAIRLIDDISKLPGHFDDRPPEYAGELRALRNAFNTEYDAFDAAISAARAMLRSVRGRVPVPDQEAITAILDALTEYQNAVNALVQTSHERFGLQHGYPREDAERTAGVLSNLVAQRRI